MGPSDTLVAVDPGPRFEIIRTLGKGGMGVVYEALDRERGQHVALKAMTSRSPGLLVRFKNEFRALQEVQHPNLVSLGELFEASGQLFFTMELVQGTGFLDHVHGDGEGDEARLRAALPQLAAGLVALHDAGKVHRDIKPSNVLVSASARVVILDFGLLTDADRGERAVLGTVNYMAPEQARGQAVGPAADWYAVGVMLFRALTGAPPFDLRGATPLEQQGRRAVIVAPSAVRPGVPRDLDELCVSLLDVDPSRRPTGRAVLGRLAPAEPGPAPPRGAVRCIGRRRELAILAEAQARAAEGPVVVAVEGDSGLGKSTLLRGFLDGLPASVIAPHGRCYERVDLPFQAVDELMDDLAERLVSLPPAEVDALLPPDFARLGEVFPVLRLGRPAPTRRPPSSLHDGSLSETVASGHTRLRAPRAPEALDPLERRARLFAAARELLARLARRGPLVLAIDDIQWADDDGMALLAEVLRPPGAPPLLLLLTRRSGLADEIGRLGAPVERIALGPMGDDDGRALCATMLRGASVDAAELVREAAGHPMLLDALVRHRITRGEAGPVHLADALRARLAALDPRARALLDPIAVAASPVRLDVIEYAAASEGEEATRLLALLRAEHLVRLSGAGREARVTLSHDRIRDAVLAELSADQRRDWHGLLAGALEHEHRGRPDELAHHLQHAGAPARAAGYAQQAGDLAAATSAFDQAARHYRTALELAPRAPDAERTLTLALAEALVNAGRGREAGDAFRRAARLAAPSAAAPLTRRAADAYLRAGYVDEGMAALREAATALGVPVPRGALEALARTATSRAALALRGALGAPAPPDARAAQRLDLCWSAATGLGTINPLLGIHFQALGLRLALDAGDDGRLARALALEAAFDASLTGRVPEAALARAESLGRRAGSDHALALVASTRGVALFSAGRVREALPELHRAEELLRERCVGVAWERGSTASYIVWSLWIAGDLAAVHRRLPLALREAEERGDRHLAANLRTSLGNTSWLLFDDDPARARREADRAMDAWSRAEGFHLQHLLDAEARLFADLYLGDAEAAGRRLDAVWLRARTALLFQVTHLRIFFTYLRALAALSSPRLQGLSTTLVRRLEREEGPWAIAFAACARACLTRRLGDGAGAEAMMGQAIARFERAGMRGYAEAARLRRGEMRGAMGRAEVEGAERWFREQGVLKPRRAAAMLVPVLAG